ncbi:hypothetical protein MPSEU_001025600 [Mayamaea pseudoterrestris]|nr:hypothetical protein MPSEU_001025600 [Mayamaea pseudoterrestris]
MTGRQRQDVEMLSKICLMRLDSLLRPLLSVVQMYQKECSQCSQQRHLELIKSQTDLLHRLDQELQSLSSMVQQASRNSNEISLAQALEPLTEYLALPLLAILKGTLLNWSLKSSSNGEKTAGGRILQSSQWKVVEMAARVYKAYVPVVPQEANASSQTPDKSQQQQQQQQLAIKVTTACAFALPSGLQVEEQAAEDTTRLDRGTDCLLALLSLILLAAASSHNQSSNSQSKLFAKQVAQAMNGALVARIVDTCVTLTKVHCGSNAQQSSAIASTIMTASNNTMQALLRAVPIVDTWRGAFPGCFAGLYQSLLKLLRATDMQSKLAAITLGTLVLLLRQTCIETSNETIEVKATAPTDELALARVQAKLQNLLLETATIDEVDFTAEKEKEPHRTTKAVSISQSTSPQPTETPEDAFFRLVRTRVGPPMIVLVRQVAGARAISVRKEAVRLYKVLLLETSAFCLYKDTALSSSDVTRATLESCMILTNDADDSVTASAKKVVQKYGRDKHDTAPIHILVSLMEELPVLAQSQRQLDLRMKLKLLSAYLAMNISPKSLYSSLCVNQSPAWLKNVFGSICDINFESFNSNMATSVSLVASGVDIVHRPKDPPPRFLDDDAQVTALQCIRNLGKALGSKFTALLVDAFIADAYESLAERVERHSSLTGVSQVAWLHEQIGAVILAKELLVGAFSVDENQEKQQRKQVRLLEDLATAILPIITSSHLFELPSTMRFIENSLDDTSASSATAAALRGNGAFTVVLLDLIGAFFCLLGNSTNRFLPTTLFAILEKTSWLSSPSVQEMALYQLDSIGRACEFNGREELLLANTDTLLGAMNARLRIPGGSMVASKFILDRNVVLVAMAAAALLSNLCSNEYYDTKRSLHYSDKSLLSQVHQLFGSLAIRFDYQAVHLSNMIVESMVFTKLFDSVLSYLLFVNKVRIVENLHAFANETTCESSWTTVLEPFQQDASASYAPAEGFALLTRMPEILHMVDREGLDDSALPDQLILVSDILSRSSYLLSHSSLAVQSASCKVMIKGFQFLGWIAANIPEREGESNGPTTAILRQVHSHWPAISARLKAISSVLALGGTPQSSLLLSGDSSSLGASQHHLGEEREFLSQLYVLVGIMCGCAGDFMPRHFREVIWPCIGKTVGLFLPSQQTRRRPMSRSLMTDKARMTGAFYAHEQKRQFSDSELGLLLGVLSCLSHVYGNRAMGTVVANLIAPAGAMILPFIDHDKLHAAAMDALKRMICIDADALYRLLMNISGQAIPAYAGNEKQQEQAATSMTAEPTSETTLEQSTRLLVTFINSLPEQAFS